MLSKGGFCFVLVFSRDDSSQWIDIVPRHFKDMQDVEFTVQEGKLWMLQCRSGKRTGHAAIKIAVDLVNEGICNREEALLNVEPDHVKQVLHPTFPQNILNSPQYKDNVIAVGLQGGPGAAVGKLCFHTVEAEEHSSEDLILVRENTSPEDVGGMWASKGILTSRGGVTSHAGKIAVILLLSLQTFSQSFLRFFKLSRGRSQLGQALCLWMQRPRY